VISAIEAQNIQVAAGQIGEPPVAGDQQQQLTVLAARRATRQRRVDQFKIIVIRTNPSVRMSGHLSDIANVQRCVRSNITPKFDAGSVPAASLSVYQAPNANALQVSQEVQSR